MRASGTVPRIVLAPVDERQLVAPPRRAAEAPQHRAEPRRPLAVVQQSVHPGAHDFRERKQPYRVAARGGVEDDEVEPRAGERHQLRHPFDQRRLAGARRMRGQIELPIDLVIEARMDERLHALLDARDVRVRGPVRDRSPGR